MVPVVEPPVPVFVPVPPPCAVCVEVDAVPVSAPAPPVLLSSPQDKATAPTTPPTRNQGRKLRMKTSGDLVYPESVRPVEPRARRPYADVTVMLGTAGGSESPLLGPPSRRRLVG